MTLPDGGSDKEVSRLLKEKLRAEREERAKKEALLEQELLRVCREKSEINKIRSSTWTHANLNARVVCVQELAAMKDDNKNLLDKLRKVGEYICTKSDIYSFGLMILELLVYEGYQKGLPVFSSVEAVVAAATAGGKWPLEVARVLAEAAFRYLEAQPSARPTAAELLSEISRVRTPEGLNGPSKLRPKKQQPQQPEKGADKPPLAHCRAQAAPPKRPQPLPHRPAAKAPPAAPKAIQVIAKAKAPPAAAKAPPAAAGGATTQPPPPPSAAGGRRPAKRAGDQGGKAAALRQPADRVGARGGEVKEAAGGTPADAAEAARKAAARRLATRRGEGKPGEQPMDRRGAKARGAGTRRLLTKPRGTTDFMAPEVQRGEYICTKSDMYSFGLMMLELLVHQGYQKGLPVFRSVEAVVAAATAGGKWPSEVARVLAEAAFRYLEAEPSKRPIAAELLSEISRVRTPEGLNGPSKLRPKKQQPQQPEEGADRPPLPHRRAQAAPPKPAQPLPHRTAAKGPPNSTKGHPSDNQGQGSAGCCQGRDIAVFIISVRVPYKRITMQWMDMRRASCHDEPRLPNQKEALRPEASLFTFYIAVGPVLHQRSLPPPLAYYRPPKPAGQAIVSPDRSKTRPTADIREIMEARRECSRLGWRPVKPLPQPKKKPPQPPALWPTGLVPRRLWVYKTPERRRAGTTIRPTAAPAPAVAQQQAPRVVVLPTATGRADDYRRGCANKRRRIA
ncbi:unnamed protein product [Vitrella brassicaformis CCMP3155]|uniref:Protein kinase domain-containing protein n=1 Tax=Vitrella brassicaformis (strain CCMP3155) TaxID=1169540 RepID=A0A0G4GHJ2_VITBC|nr:unnamed protein product [Vitrella brassicaformis CCMP3155]|eukprot:CEM29201.1 unnamed protein product [Vitrella brassicaformis CCMP3155]